MATKDYMIRLLWLHCNIWMAALQYLGVSNQQTTGTKIVCF
jgi:hypothetical protein